MSAGFALPPRRALPSLRRVSAVRPSARRPGPALAALALGLGLGLGGACRAPVEAPPPPAEAPPAPKPAYSPFVVQMSVELPFDRVSFKDVGMSVDPDERAYVYEEVAQSVAASLSADPELPLSSEVLYSEAVADPDHHLACGAHQIYVDVWAPQGVERWGYSLWSGCSEEDRFAFEEIDREDARDVDALGRGIAAALRRAVETRCFVRSC